MNFDVWFREQHPKIPLGGAQAVLKLKEEGCSIPFIARYRKEQTGNLDEVQIQDTIESFEAWEEILHRQKYIVGEIEKQNKLTPELKEKILSTFVLNTLEDLFLPYKQKRKSKATKAKDAGLLPLADWIWNCGHGTETPQEGQTLEIWAFTFRNEKEGYNDAVATIEGAQDILIERLSEMQDLREVVRKELFEHSVIRTEKGSKAQEHSKFDKYFKFEEPISSLKQPQNSHRYLALRRGWSQDELRLSFAGKEGVDLDEKLLQVFENRAFISTAETEKFDGKPLLLKAAKLALKAHVQPSIETEVHTALKKVADEIAIKVFAENVRKVLLAPPLGPKSVLGVDPGIRTGCKIAVINSSGKYLADTVMYLQNDNQKIEAKKKLTEAIKNAGIEAIAVGNGTAGRETETFIRTTLKEDNVAVPVIMVNEAGASVYSASSVAREEFPELDVTVKGAISIARRLQDPLAELVKIDPKSIGVGQYQHDVSQPALKKSLEYVVESCVNMVGVNLNTASYHLLAHVSGIGEGLAKNIVEFREKFGLFKSRTDVEKVPRFTKKAFEQAAGFLKIPESENPLDNTGVHPEKYEALEEIAKSVGKTVKDFIGKGVEVLKSTAQAKEKLGEFTFQDIVKELEKPGRDPREGTSLFSYREDVLDMKDLKLGMILPGVVTNVTNFGAFVDIGVHQDGLVHISQLSHKFVSDAAQVVQPGDQVKVKVLEVNLDKKQIALTMRLEEKPQQKNSGQERRPQQRPPVPTGPAPVIQKAQPGKNHGPAPRPGPRPEKKQFKNNPFASLGSIIKK